MLQVARHHEFVERAQKQQQRTFEVAPRRGVLYDRNLHELAMTVQVDSIYAVPTEIDDKQTAAHALAAVVHTDPEDAQTTEEQIAARLNNGRNFAWVARRVTPEVAARVHAMTGTARAAAQAVSRASTSPKSSSASIRTMKLPRRCWAMWAWTITAWADWSRSSRRNCTEFRAACIRPWMRGGRVLGSSEHDPEPGQNLVLTIDEDIQFLAERALDHAMQRTQAESGTVVVQDVHTGQILALAIRPTFNPNSFRHTTPELLRNHAVSDVYEPGSTFKLVTYSAALEQHVVTPDDIIDCQGGRS